MIRAASYSRWSCGRARWLLTGVLTAVALGVVPSPAAAQACPSADQSYTGNCGPMFAVPSWTDAGGWNEPSQYSTIRLADVNGDGKDELIGRSDAGVEIYQFDTTLGQWRPQVDAGGIPQLLNDFASLPHSIESNPTNPNLPQYYSTIQAADVDGQPGAEILGRFWDGMRVYKYTPPNGGGIDGGSWSRIGTAGPFSDADGYGDPSLYSTIQVAKLSIVDPPVLFARRKGSTPDLPSLVSYTWQGGAWQSGTGKYGGPYFSDQACGQPSCYLDIKVGALMANTFASDRFKYIASIIGRHPQLGLITWTASSSTGRDDGGPTPGNDQGDSFADAPSTLDCPFSASGATGPGSGDCVGSSPSYYETWQAADVNDAHPGDELLVRASDGLRLRWIASENYPEPLKTGPTLTALAGAPSDVPAGMWSSIRTGDIDGNGRDEVLFLDRNGNGLQAYSYDPAANAWNQLPSSTPLALGSDPWLSHPEYYSTIQTGDVDGDGRDDVIARGPYGIRTWFYNRRQTGGWERYLPEGYPAFPGTATTPGQPDTGQAWAFDYLNTAAKYDGVIPKSATTVRDVWASENRPSPTDLTQLNDDLVRIGNCTGPSTTEPVSYQTCTPPPPTNPPFPPGTSAPDPATWTAVINQILTENYYAGKVLDVLKDFDTMRESLFLDESSVLPAIGDDLGLQAAAGSTGQFNALPLVSGGLGIAASIAGVVPGGAEASALLWIGAEVASMIPQSSPTATTAQFQSTYAGLTTKFAQMVGEVGKGMDVQSQEMRQDIGLLSLVGQLRQSGAWNFDVDGIKSAANQGFAISVYQALMPTVYDRYDITGCQDSDDHTPAGAQFPVGPFAHFNCLPAPDIPGVAYQDSQNFISIGQAASPDGYPCFIVYSTGVCAYDRVPGDDTKNANPSYVLSRRIWGPVSADCSYIPGNSATEWAFTKTCNAGVDDFPSVAMNTWGFTSHSGSPDWAQAWSCGTRGMISPCDSAAATAQAQSQAPIRLGRPRSGRRRAVRGGAQMGAEIGTLRGMRLGGATVTVNRLLFESGHGELTHPTRAQRPLKLRLSRVGAGRFMAVSGGRRPVRVVVRRDRGGRASLKLTSARVYHTPHACHALPAAVALESPPLWLETRLVISDGRNRRPVVLRHHVRCRRDERGNVNRLEYVRYRQHRPRGGLTVTLRGPRSVAPGATASYVARVQNRREARDRMVSSLWDITLTAGTRTKRIHELRRGRTRTFAFTVSVPRSAGSARLPGTPPGRFCTVVGARAPGARAESARVCSRVRAALPPRFTG